MNLKVAYKSQHDEDAGKTNNDCGNTSTAMVLNYYGENLTSDQVFDKTGAGKGLISVSQLQKAISSFGYRSEYLTNSSPEVIKSCIDKDIPVIALVHYGSLNSTQDKKFKGGHFFVVVGYREDGYFVNDPNFKGDLRKDGDHHFYTKQEFEKAWSDAALDNNPAKSFILIYRKTEVPQNDSLFANLLKDAGVTTEPELRAMIGDAKLYQTTKKDKENADKEIDKLRGQIEELKEELKGEKTANGTSENTYKDELKNWKQTLSTDLVTTQGLPEVRRAISELKTDSDQLDNARRDTKQAQEKLADKMAELNRVYDGVKPMIGYSVDNPEAVLKAFELVLASKNTQKEMETSQKLPIIDKIMQSKTGTLNKEDVRKILIGAGVAMVGALLTFGSEQIPNVNFGVWTPLVMVAWSIIANTVRKLIAPL